MSGKVLVPEPSPSRSETLQGLAARVAAATGPDRELDCRIWCSLVEGVEFRKVLWAPEGFKNPDGSRRWHAFRTSAGDKPNHPVPAYTASLDAALALVERVLPGWGGMVTFGHDGNQTAYLYGPVEEIGTDEDGEDVVIRDEATGEAKTPALALQSALLAALATRPEKPE